MARTDSTGEREATLLVLLEQSGSVVPLAVHSEGRGQEKGLAQGLREGCEEIRGIHLRQARTLRRMVSERLAVLLRPVRLLG